MISDTHLEERPDPSLRKPHTHPLLQQFSIPKFLSHFNPEKKKKILEIHQHMPDRKTVPSPPAWPSVPCSQVMPAHTTNMHQGSDKIYPGGC